MKLYQNLQIYKDKRGIIQDLLPEGAVKSVQLITGEKGAERGKHYHKKDVHYCYILSGKIRYFFSFGDENPEFIDLKVGDCVANEPLEKHKFVFLAKGSFIAMAIKERSQANYEKDVVRVDY